MNPAIAACGSSFWLLLSHVPDKQGITVLRVLHHAQDVRLAAFGGLMQRKTGAVRQPEMATKRASTRRALQRPTFRCNSARRHLQA